MASKTGLRLLLVDDNKNFTDLLALGLRACGHTVMCVNNPTWAVDVARHFRPHALLSDLSMPTLDGLALARLVREEPELKGIRLIAGTGNVEPDSVNRCIEAGFDVFLQKPFTHKEIHAMVTPRVTTQAAA